MSSITLFVIKIHLPKCVKPSSIVIKNCSRSGMHDFMRSTQLTVMDVCWSVILNTVTSF